MSASGIQKEQDRQCIVRIK